MPSGYNFDVITGNETTGIMNVDSQIKANIPITLTEASDADDHRYQFAIPGVTKVQITIVTINNSTAVWAACYSQPKTVAEVAADFANRNTGQSGQCSFFWTPRQQGFWNMEMGPFAEPVSEVWIVSGGSFEQLVVINGVATTATS